MARKVKEVTIGETQYRMTQLGGSQGADLWLDLLRVLAGPVEAFAKSRGALEGVDEESVGLTVVAAGIKALDHATVAKMTAAFQQHTTIRVIGPDGGERWPTLSSAVYDEHFAGNYLELSEWLVQSVVFNFLPFVVDGSLGSVVAKIQGMMPGSTPTTT